MLIYVIYTHFLFCFAHCKFKFYVAKTIMYNQYIYVIDITHVWFVLYFVFAYTIVNTYAVYCKHYLFVGFIAELVSVLYDI